MTKSYLEKRSMRINGHRTSVALEFEFWRALERLARVRETSIPRLVADIQTWRETNLPAASLASAVRVYLLTFAGHTRRRDD